MFSEGYDQQRLSPILFKIYSKKALNRYRKSCSGMEIQTDDEPTLHSLHLTDYQVVSSEDPDELDFMAKRTMTCQYYCNKNKYTGVSRANNSVSLENGRINQTYSNINLETNR